jgi:YVTN family beta-propeller protein
MLNTPVPKRTLLPFAGLLLTLTGCGGGGGDGGDPTPPPTPASSVARFAYLANTGDDTLSLFIADNTTGRLRHHGYVRTGDGPTGVTIDPSGQYTYTLNSNSQDISLFQVDSLSGALSESECDLVNATLTCGTGGGTPISMVFGSSGRFAYVANQYVNTITVHELDSSTGALSSFNSVQPPVDDAAGGSNFPVKLSLHPSGDFLYVVHEISNDVTIYGIDANDGTLLPITGSPVASSGTGSIDIAITPNGNYAYLANSTSGDISLYTIDASGFLIANSVTASITTGLVPQALAVDPTGQWLYMISREETGSVALFEIQSDGTLVQANCGTTTTCPAGDMPTAITLDPTGQFVSVANGSGNTVNLYRIDQSSGQLSVISNLLARSNPAALSYYSDTVEVSVTPRYAYVGNFDGISINAYSIDASNGSLASIGTPVTTAGKPTSLAADRSGSYLYATNDVTDNVSVYAINSGTGALTEISGSPFSIETNPTGPEAGPISISLDPSGRFAYVANSTDSLSAYTIDSNTGALTLMADSPITTGDNPSSITVDPTGRFLFSANLDSDDVSIFGINVNTGVPALLGTIAAENAPNSIAVDPSGRFVYVANVGIGSYNISAYSIALTSPSDLLVEIPGSPFSVPNANAPFSLSVDPLGEFLYVANQSSQNVTHYTINQSTGALTAGENITTEANPQAITVDPSGQYVYVANHGSNSVSGYTVDSDTGALTAHGASIATSTSPRSIITTGVLQ